MSVETLHVDGPAVHRLPPDYVSITLDTSQFIGGYWWEGSQRIRRGVGERRVAPFDFTTPGLRRYASAIAPAVLRVGGSEADKLYYHLGDSPVGPPPGFDYVLSRRRWDELVEFAAGAGMRLVFTINAGPGPRGRQRRWSETNARSLMAYAYRNGHPVVGWELGNEINAFVVIHGLRGRVTARRYASDFRRFRATVHEAAPGSYAAGPASAFWPVLGEFQRVTEPFLKRVDGAIDVLTWHYYPQQSDRGPFATRRASLRALLDPAALDDAGKVLTRLAGYRDRHSGSDVPIWLGETGNAQFGGQAGVSDRFAGTLWWIDELGLMARHGADRVFRQTLVGADYGLLDYRSGEPNPDYWATLIWKRLCGTEVYAVAKPRDPRVRLYALSRADGAAGIVLVAINLNEASPRAVRVSPRLGPVQEVYSMEAESLDSRAVRVNEVEPSLELFEDRKALLRIARRGSEGEVSLTPLSVTWMVVGEE